jgi:hypothetical protein
VLVHRSVDYTEIRYKESADLFYYYIKIWLRYSSLRSLISFDIFTQHIAAVPFL